MFPSRKTLNFCHVLITVDRPWEDANEIDDYTEQPPVGASGALRSHYSQPHSLQTCISQQGNTTNKSVAHGDVLLGCSSTPRLSMAFATLHVEAAPQDGSHGMGVPEPSAFVDVSHIHVEPTCVCLSYANIHVS